MVLTNAERVLRFPKSKQFEVGFKCLLACIVSRAQSNTARPCFAMIWIAPTSPVTKLAIVNAEENHRNSFCRPIPSSDLFDQRVPGDALIGIGKRFELLWDFHGATTAAKVAYCWLLAQLVLRAEFAQKLESL